LPTALTISTNENAGSAHSNQTNRSLNRSSHGDTGLGKVVKYRARKETENGVSDPAKNTPVPLPVLWAPEPE
jgi:hypothetical protein